MIWWIGAVLTGIANKIPKPCFLRPDRHKSAVQLRLGYGHSLKMSVAQMSKLLLNKLRNSCIF